MLPGQFIGVDVGGTKVAAAAIERGVHSEPEITPTDTSNSEALLDQIVASIESVRGPDARAVGIGVPSVVEFATGRVRYSVNVPLADLPLRQLLTERVGLPVYIENDGACSALAEAYEGEDVVSPNLVMLTVGTGVGGGVVIDGKVFRGFTGAGGEVGHIIIGMDLSGDVPPASEKFPQRGSLESLAAGRALDRLAHEAAEADPDSPLGRVLAENGKVGGRHAVEAAQAGDEAAAALVRRLGQRLGVGIANMINIFDPESVVLGGGVSAAGDLLLEPAREVARQYTLRGVGTETTIRLARRGPEAGVVGAALLAVQELTEDLHGSEEPPITRG